VPEPVTIEAAPRICFHPGDAWLALPDDPQKNTGSKCFHPGEAWLASPDDPQKNTGTKCFHPGEAWLASLDDPQKGTGSKCFHPGDTWLASAPVSPCFHPADDDPSAELRRSLTEIDGRALAALAGR